MVLNMNSPVTGSETSRLVDATVPTYVNAPARVKTQANFCSTKFVFGTVSLFSIVIACLTFWPTKMFPFQNDQTIHSFGQKLDATTTKSESSASNPNIIFILMDDLGFADISARGAEFTTPNLDDLYSNSIVINNHYIGLVCSPSRSQMISGRYAWNFGMSAMLAYESISVDALPAAIPTIGNLLHLYTNYKTYWSGKWHLGMPTEDHLPLQRGWDQFYGFYSTSIGYDDKLVKLDEFDTQYLDWRNMEAVDYDTQYDYSTFVTGDYALDAINDHVDSFGVDTPFFLKIPFQATHANTVNVDSENSAQCDEISDDTRQKMCQTVLAVDEVVGNIVSNLKDDTNIWDNTLIVFTADNGATYRKGGCNYPLRGGKHMFFEGGIRTIAFVAGGYVEELEDVQMGARDGLMHGADWVPTLLTIAGADVEQIDADLVENVYVPVAKQASEAETGSEANYKDYLLDTAFDGKDVSSWLLTGAQDGNERDEVPLSINDLDVDDDARETDVALVFESKYTGRLYKWMNLADDIKSSKANTELCMFTDVNEIDALAGNLDALDAEDLMRLDPDETDDYSQSSQVLSVQTVKKRGKKVTTDSSENTDVSADIGSIEKVLSDFETTSTFLFDLSSEENELTNLLETFLEGFEVLEVSEEDSQTYETNGALVEGVEADEGYDATLVSLIWQEGLEKAKDFYENSLLANDYLACADELVPDDADPSNLGNGDAFAPFYTWDEYVDKLNQLCPTEINPVLKVLFETKFDEYMQ